MSVIKVDEFMGVAPAISPLKLATGAAQTCTNAKIEANSLVPEKGSTAVSEVPNGTQSIFKTKYNGTHYWISSPSDLDFAMSPVNTDRWSRIYAAGGTYPEYSSFSEPANYSAISGRVDNPSPADPVQIVHPLQQTYRLGIPKPLNALIISGGSTITGNTGEVTATTSYVYTVVSHFGEEGPPSPPTPLTEYVVTQSNNDNNAAGAARTLSSGIGSPPAAIEIANSSNVATTSFSGYAFGTNFGNAKIRIYRTATGSDSTSFLFVKEIAWSSSWQTTDNLSDADLGEALPSTYYFAPPNDNLTYSPDGPLKALVSMAGGFFAGFTGKTVSFSELFLPHAWPPQNSLVTESDIVAIKETTYGLVVLTTTRPYIVQGTDPNAMSMVLLDIDQACVSKRSVGDMGGTVIYASPDGLVGIEGEKTRLLTEGVITRSQWQSAYYPSTMKSAVFEGRYYAFFDSGSGYNKALILDVNNPSGPISVVNFTYTSSNFASHTSAEDDKFFYVAGAQLYEWGAGTNLSVNWKSKKFFTPIDSHLVWGRVLADADVDLKIYVDGDEKFEATILNDTVFRLPPTMRGKKIEIEIVKTLARVDGVTLASNRNET